MDAAIRKLLKESDFGNAVLVVLISGRRKNRSMHEVQSKKSLILNSDPYLGKRTGFLLSTVVSRPKAKAGRDGMKGSFVLLEAAK